VLEPLVAAGIEIVAYPDGPGRPPPVLADLGLVEGDALLVVNHLGLRSAPDLTGASRRGIDVIEDHTHDPWSPWAFASMADFCLASLRKTLPLPDGAVVWSPPHHRLPSEPPATPEHERAAAAALQGAILKGLALGGQEIGPDDYRPIVVAAEDELARARPSAITALSRFLLSIAPVAEWRAARRQNFEVLATELERHGHVEVLRPQSPGAAPFVVTITFQSGEERDRCREELIAARIYPAVLWPLERTVVDDIPDADLSLSRRVLSLHCDMRYAPADLRRVASTMTPVPAP
jgi:hypothetical protein